MNSHLDYAPFSEIFHDKFTPAYADLVAFYADKPPQILGEMENTFIHLMQTTNPNIPHDKRRLNLDRAECHLIRTTLDCHKLIWAEMEVKLSKIMNDHVALHYGLNTSDHQFLQMYEDFLTKARAARKHEMENVGVAPLDSIIMYEKATTVGWEMLKLVDRTKIKGLKWFKLRYEIRRQMIGFIVGVIAALLVAICQWCWL